MAYCYIIYSHTLDRYYIGSTHETFESRLLSHNTGKYAGSFTSQVRDWEEYLKIETETYGHARRLEISIKKQKSRVYLENLKRYPDMVERLKKKTST